MDWSIQNMRVSLFAEVPETLDLESLWAETISCELDEIRDIRKEGTRQALGSDESFRYVINAEPGLRLDWRADAKSLPGFTQEAEDDLERFVNPVVQWLAQIESTDAGLPFSPVRRAAVATSLVRTEDSEEEVRAKLSEHLRSLDIPENVGDFVYRRNYRCKSSQKLLINRLFHWSVAELMTVVVSPAETQSTQSRKPLLTWQADVNNAASDDDEPINEVGELVGELLELVKVGRDAGEPPE